MTFALRSVLDRETPNIATRPNDVLTENQRQHLLTEVFFTALAVLGSFLILLQTSGLAHLGPYAGVAMMIGSPVARGMIVLGCVIGEADFIAYVVKLAMRFNAMIERARKNKTTADEHSQEITTLKGEIQTLKGNKTNLEKEIAQLKGELETAQKTNQESESKISELKGEIKTLKDNGINLRSEITRLKLELETAQQEADKISGLEKEIDDLYRKNADLDATNDKLVQNVISPQGTPVKPQPQPRTRSLSSSEVRPSFAANSELQELGQTYQKLVRERQQARDENNKLKKQITALQNKLTQTQEKIKTEAQLEELKTELAQKQKQIAEKEARLNELHDQIAKAKQHLENTEQLGQQAKNRVTEQINKLNELKASNSKLTTPPNKFNPQAPELV